MLLVAGLIPIAIVAEGTQTAGAAPSAPSIGGIAWDGGSGLVVPFEKDLAFTVTGLPSAAVKGQIEVIRLPGSDEVNQFPYYRQAIDKPGSGTSVNLPVPFHSFQADEEYEWRARIWYPGQGGDPSPWSSWGSFVTTAEVENRPSVAYPMTPLGDVGATDLILKADGSWKPSPDSGDDVETYRFEIKGGSSPDVLWSQDVAAPARSNATRVSVNVPNYLLGEGIDYRWRLYAIDENSKSSRPSRWRYFRTLSRALMDQQYWYINNRAGSYVSGLDNGDEASGLVASKQYPGVYWYIRDNAPGEDRAFLYALKIDPVTRLIDNLGGVATREIAVVAGGNIDGGPAGIDNIDWEAITVDDSGNLYVGDVGDYWDLDDRNRNNDPLVPDTRVYKITEPNPETATTATVTAVDEYRYPANVNRNAESLFWHNGHLFLISKEGGGVARLYRIDLGTGQAVDLGAIDSQVDPVTDVDVSDDGRYLAMTTEGKRLVVHRNYGSSTGQQRVVDLATAPQETSHYYYRSAAAMDADGTIGRRLLDPRFNQPAGTEPAQSVQYTQLGMQVEGAAFQHGGSGLGMISEFGKHVLFVPMYDWMQRNGAGYGGPWEHETQPNLSGLPRPSAPQVADPVSTATGNFAHEDVDLVAPTSTWGMGLRRTYNSTDTEAEGFGPGWSWSYGMDLEVLDQEAILSGPDGRRMVYARRPSGGWDRPPEFTGELTSSAGAWTITFADGSAWQFDGSGDLTGMTNWDGQTIDVTRSSGRITGLDHSSGHELTISYDGSGRIDEVTDGVGRTVSYGYTGSQLTSATVPGGGTTTYQYVGAGSLISEIEDPSGRLVVENSYDGQRRVVEQVQPGGTETTFVYGSNGTTTVTESPSGTALTYEHDGAGRVVGITDSLSNTITFDYDEDGNPTRSIGRTGRVEDRTWNARGIATEVTDAGGATTTVAVDPNARPTVIDSERGTVALGYEGSERLPSTVEDSEGNVHTQVIADGLIASTVDPDGVTAEFIYDSARRVTKVVNSLGEETTFTYDTRGNKASQTDAAGETTTYTYDTADRIATETAPNGGVTEFTYDAADRVLTVTDEEDAETSYTYDAAGNLATATYPGGLDYAYTYDTNGNRTTSTDPAGKITTNTYGPLGRLETTTDPTGSTTTHVYDEDGKVSSTTSDGEGTTATVTDPAGRPGSVTGPQGTSTFTYDEVGNLASATNPGARTSSFTYDPLGRVATSTDPRGSTTSYAYTDGGRLASTTSPLGTTSYTYDDAGRTATETAPGGLTTTYAYDAAGDLESVTSPGGGVTTYTYDETGNIATVTDPAGVQTTHTWSLRSELLTRKVGTSGTEIYTYDEGGRVATATNGNGDTTTYTYDDRGQLASQTDPLGGTTEFEYNDDGRLATEIDPLDRETTYTYDEAGRPATSTDGSGRTVTNTWDDAGRLVSHSAGGDTTTFSYNTANERTGASGPDGSWAWTYDAGGLLLAETAPGSRTTKHTYDAGARDTSLTYPDGTKVAYTYDSANRLDTVTSDLVMVDNATAANGRSPDKTKWTTSTFGGGSAAIDSNAIRMSFAATGATGGTLEANTAPIEDAEVVLKYRFSSATNDGRFRIHLRSAPGDISYRVEIRADNNTAYLFKQVGATFLKLEQFTTAGNTGWQWVRFRVEGSTISARQWADGTAEPSTWRRSVTDTAIAGAGKLQLQWSRVTHGAADVEIDDVSIRDLDGPRTIASYDWDADGLLTSEQLPGGSRTWTWDDQRLAGYSQTIGATTNTATVAYDGAGRIAEQTVGAVTTDYAYDLASQLLEADPSTGPTASWSYDELGRRTASALGAATTTYAYDAASQLTTSTPSTGPVTTYAYDGGGRRTSATTGGATTTLGYDPYGRLQTTSTATTTEARTYGPNDQLDSIATTISAATTTSRLTWDTSAGTAELVSFDDGGTENLVGPASLHSATIGAEPTTVPVDLFGSVTGGTLARGAAYDPFGATTTVAPNGLTLGYRGELHGGENVHLRARQYAPTLGSFTTVDPLEDVAGTPTVGNRYHYGYNDPLNRTDPTGLRPGGGSLTDGNLSPRQEAADKHAAEALKAKRQREDAGAFPSGVQLGDIASGLLDGAIDGIDVIGFISSLIETNPMDIVNGLKEAVETLLSGDAGAIFEELVLPALGIDLDKCEDRGLDYCIAFAVGGLAVQSGVMAIAKQVKSLKQILNRACHSFAAQTPVLMADGKTKPIAAIEIGDEVVSYSTDEGRRASRRVTDTFVTLHRDDLIDLTVHDGQESGLIQTTDEHPFWSVTGQAWVQAAELELGEILRQADGTDATVVSVTERDGIEPMWDLTVAIDHTFFVAFNDGDSVLTHNKGDEKRINLGEGFTGRVDTFNTGDGASFEIHVWDKNNKEVGVFGTDGFFNKHGTKAVNVTVPESVEARLKGIAVDKLRKIGRLGPKGTADISGDKWKQPKTC